MKRRLLNLLTALSLLLCVAVGVLWVRSIWIADYFERVRDGKIITIESACGFLRIATDTDATIQDRPWHRDPRSTAYYDEEEVAAARPGLRELGIRFDSEDSYFLVQVDDAGDDIAVEPNGSHEPSWSHYRSVMVCYWLIVALTAALPLIRLGQSIRRRRRRKAGCCPNCGYDLRATPDRCPECGDTRPGATA